MLLYKLCMYINSYKDLKRYLYSAMWADYYDLYSRWKKIDDSSDVMAVTVGDR